MALTLAQRVEAGRLHAKLDERRYIRGLIEAARRDENLTDGLRAMNPNPIRQPARRREYVFTTQPPPQCGAGGGAGGRARQRGSDGVRRRGWRDGFGVSGLSIHACA